MDYLVYHTLHYSPIAHYIKYVCTSASSVLTSVFCCVSTPLGCELEITASEFVFSLNRHHFSSYFHKKQNQFFKSAIFNHYAAISETVQDGDTVTTEN